MHGLKAFLPLSSSFCCVFDVDGDSPRTSIRNCSSETMGLPPDFVFTIFNTVDDDGLEGLDECINLE